MPGGLRRAADDSETAGDGEHGERPHGGRESLPGRPSQDALSQSLGWRAVGAPGRGPESVVRSRDPAHAGAVLPTRFHRGVLRSRCHADRAGRAGRAPGAPAGGGRPQPHGVRIPSGLAAADRAVGQGGAAGRADGRIRLHGDPAAVPGSDPDLRLWDRASGRSAWPFDQSGDRTAVQEFQRRRQPLRRQQAAAIPELARDYRGSYFFYYFNAKVANR
jgi:hypothetical protein